MRLTPRQGRPEAAQTCKSNENKRATPKWVTKSCDNRYIMKYVGEIASKIRQVVSYLTHFWDFFTLTLGQGLRHLGHWMHIYGLYLGTKYEVCRWNNIWDMASCLVFYPFFENLTMTCDLDLRSSPSALGSLNAPYWVVPWYQVWSW